MEVAKAEWIEVKPLQQFRNLAAAQARFGLGLGELSTILLAKELGAALVLMDEESGRWLAREEGLEVRGTVGIVERLYQGDNHLGVDFGRNIKMRVNFRKEIKPSNLGKDD